MSELQKSTSLIRESFFPTLIYYWDVPDGAALNASLLAAIRLEREEDTVGMHRSNVKQTGAWHSRDSLNRSDEYEGLTRYVLEAAQQVFDNLLYEPSSQPLIDNMWANVSPRNAFNRMHIHPGVIWSGVYYVQTPENCGRIYFSDPRSQALVLRPRVSSEGMQRPENWSEVYYEPVAGRLLLFPAWLDHEVEPNLAAEDGDAGHRISISFNIIQRPRNTGEDPPATAS